MSPKRRSVTILGVTMILIGVAAVMAATAFAVHSGHMWEINGKNLTNGQSETVGCEKEAGSTLTLTTEVAGQKLRLTAGKIECLEGKIVQDIEGEVGRATGTGKVRFSEVTVDEPVGCGVKSPIETVSLQSEIITKGGVAYGTVKPASGTTYTNITLTGCAAAETYPVKGTACGKGEPLGTMLVNQRGESSEAVDKVCSEDALTVGGKPAHTSGEVTGFLTGVNIGLKWGATAY